MYEKCNVVIIEEEFHNKQLEKLWREKDVDRDWSGGLETDTHTHTDVSQQVKRKSVKEN